MNEGSERIRGGGGHGVWLWASALVVFAAALVLGGYFFFLETKKTAIPAAPVFTETTGFAGPRAHMTLYFPRKDGGSLGPETRDVRGYQDKGEQMRELVRELLRGPVSDGLAPSFPAGARVKGVFLDASGTAYVNFSREIQTDYPGGAWTETLTIYSLANTLTDNFPEVKRVQIIVEGAPADTLAGHIDISRPIAPRRALDKE